MKCVACVHPAIPPCFILTLLLFHGHAPAQAAPVEFPGGGLMKLAALQTAKAELGVYTLSCAVEGAGTCTASPPEVPHGGVSEITVTPAYGWHVAGVTDSAEGAKSGSYTTGPVHENRTITASFSVNTHQITCIAEGEGTCSASPETVIVGETSEITVIPGEGWHVAGVTDSIEGEKGGGYTTGQVFEDRTVRAVFEKDVYTVTFVVTGGGVCGANPPLVEYGGVTEIILTPAAGGHVDSVAGLDRAAAVEGPGVTGDGQTAYTVSGVRGNLVVSVVFHAAHSNLSAWIEGDSQVTIEGNSTRTFAVGYSGAGGPVSFQWHADTGGGMAVLPGENGETLCLEAACEEDSGVYYCAVSDDWKTVDTAPVTLTVLPQVPAAGIPGLTLLGATVTVLGVVRRRVFAG